LESSGGIRHNLAQMAILIDAATVVVTVRSLNARFPGGLDAFMEHAPNATYRSDGDIAGISFMLPADAWLFVRSLTQHGFVDPSTTPSADVAVVEQQAGLLAPCDWLNLDLTRLNLPDGRPFAAAIAWVGAKRPKTFAAFEGWTPGTMQPIGSDELQQNYELVKVDRPAEGNGAVATSSRNGPNDLHRPTGTGGPGT